MKYFLFALLLLLVAAPVRAQECAPLSTEAQAHLRLRQERVEDLGKLFRALAADGAADDEIADLMRWAVLADSAARRASEVEFPACDRYENAAARYEAILTGAYKTGVQLALLTGGGLTDFQQTNVNDLLSAGLKQLTADIAEWKALTDE